MHVSCLGALRFLVVSWCLFGFAACKQNQFGSLNRQIKMKKNTIPISANDSKTIPSVTVKPVITQSNGEKKTRTSHGELFECNCWIKDQKIYCMLINRSSSCVLYNHQEDGPVSYLYYVDKKGCLGMVTPGLCDSIYFPHLVALYPVDNDFNCGSSHIFTISIPSDCKKIESLTFEISYVPFSEFEKIHDINDLWVVFMRNTAKVRAVFDQSLNGSSK